MYASGKDQSEHIAQTHCLHFVVVPNACNQMGIGPATLMADSNVDLLAGAGGLLMDDAQSDHNGRKALLLVRNNEDCSEFVALAHTMGIHIVERIDQRGKSDSKWFLGRGKLQDIVEDLRSSSEGHPWNGVDLLLLHTNATPRQLVGVNDAVGVEVWDRVRLLLALFTAHASSVEARTQVRIARLQSDRTVLREIVKLQTTGERAGYGGAGQTAAGSILTNVNRELTALRKRQRKQVKSATERRRQRKQHAMTIGLAGYTNAGKSSLFRRLSGKEVLVEDRLFSTLESTLGRLESSPRILLADTIGFIDGLPNATLEAFRATLAEAIECDLLLLLIDLSDNITEMERKIRTSIRELTERALDADDTSIMERMQPVLTKADAVVSKSLDAVQPMLSEYGLSNPLVVSSHTGEGLDELKSMILNTLLGPKKTLVILDGQSQEMASKAILSRIYDAVYVHEHIELPNGIEVQISATDETISMLSANHDGRIQLK